MVVSKAGSLRYETWKGMTHKDDLKEHLLVDLHELLVPLINIGGLLAGVVVIVGRRGGVVPVVLAPLDHFPEDRVVDIGNGNRLSGQSLLAQIVNQVLDEHRALGNHAVCKESVSQPVRRRRGVSQKSLVGETYQLRSWCPHCWSA